MRTCPGLVRGFAVGPPGKMPDGASSRKHGRSRSDSAIDDGSPPGVNGRADLLGGLLSGWRSRSRAGRVNHDGQGMGFPGRPYLCAPSGRADGVGGSERPGRRETRSRGGEGPPPNAPQGGPGGGFSQPHGRRCHPVPNGSGRLRVNDADSVSVARIATPPKTSSEKRGPGLAGNSPPAG